MRRFLLTSLVAFAATFGGAVVNPSVAEPLVVRFGYPGVGTDNRPFAFGDIFSIAHANHYIEQELAYDPGIKVEWTFFRGAGPALNESLAAGRLDFAVGLGDLPSLIGRANGLKTRFLIVDKLRDTLYLAVRPDSNIKTVEDLAGRRLSEFKGTNLQFAVDRVLAAHGLSERNAKFVNLDQGGALAALVGGSIDGTFGSIELLGLRDRGIVKIPFDTKAQSTRFGRAQATFVTDAFEKAHPEVVQHVVNALVKAAHYAADESNRAAVFETWAKSGYPAAAFAEDHQGERQANRLDPLLDAYAITHYTNLAKQARELGLVRRDVDVSQWFEPKYLDAALKAQHLETYWPRYDAAGKKLADGDVERTKAALR